MNLVDNAEIDRYLDAVRDAFADLPAAELDELLEDVADHLIEVSIESDGPLADRLGPPPAYAEELRSVAGVPAAGAGARVGARLRMRRSAADRRLGRVLGYDRFSDFLRQLAPAWWVIRGYAAAMLLTWLVDRPDGPLPRIAGSVVLGVLLAVPLIAVSIWLGRHSGGLRGRYPAWLANAALALVMVAGLTQVDVRLRGAPDEPAAPSLDVAVARGPVCYYVAQPGELGEDRVVPIYMRCMATGDLEMVALALATGNSLSLLLVGRDESWPYAVVPPAPVPYLDPPAPTPSNTG